MNRLDEILTACGSEDQLKNAKACSKLADETAQYSPTMAAVIREVAEAMLDMHFLANQMIKDRNK